MFKSVYINVHQTIAIVGGLALGFYYISSWRKINGINANPVTDIKDWFDKKCK